MNNRYRIASINRKTTDVVVIELYNPKGEVLNFVPGQYALLAYRKSNGRLTDKHAFSIASSPSERDQLRFGIKVGGKFTSGLANLKAGDEVFVSGPFGKFTFDKERHRNLVMIAGGIGITPFYSTILYASRMGLDNKLSLLYSSRTVEGVLFKKEIRDLTSENKNFRSMFCYTNEKIADGPDAVVGRITSQVISEFTGNTLGKTYFICGPAPFMAAMRANLISLGVTANRIETEEFAMFEKARFWPELKKISFAVGLAAAVTLSLFLVFVNQYPTTAGLLASFQGQAAFFPWYVARSAGITAYILMFFILVWGAGMNTGFTYRLVEPARAWVIHRYLAIGMTVTVFAHAFSWLFDEIIGFSLSQILIPFASPHKPLYVAPGVIGFYLLLLIILTSLLWRVKKPRFWRVVHYFTYLLFVFVLLHGLLVGTDSKTSAMQIIYWTTGTVFVFLVLYRFYFYYLMTRRITYGRTESTEVRNIRT